jgi:hypothetical protein
MNVADDIHDAIITEILQRAYPAGCALLEKERGSALLRYGARRVMSSPVLAQQVLGNEEAAHLGRAMEVVGERLASDGRRMQQPSADGESASPKACSGVTPGGAS